MTEIQEKAIKVAKWADTVRLWSYPILIGVVFTFGVIAKDYAKEIIIEIKNNTAAVSQQAVKTDFLIEENKDKTITITQQGLDIATLKQQVFDISSSTK